MKEGRTHSTSLSPPILYISSPHMSQCSGYRTGRLLRREGVAAWLEGRAVGRTRGHSLAFGSESWMDGCLGCLGAAECVLVTPIQNDILSHLSAKPLVQGINKLPTLYLSPKADAKLALSTPASNFTFSARLWLELASGNASNTMS